MAIFEPCCRHFDWAEENGGMLHVMLKASS
jgi:hypothetical protein